ncbi:MAG: SufE family protein [Alphaproteobacteria bacterium]|nr:SufE family protein [Alphaproteobacteria bacterium]
MPILESEQQLIDNFELFDNWEDRYSYLIDLGKKLPPMAETLKTDGALVKGCTSKVWLVHTLNGNKHTFLTDSDAHIVKGILYVLLCLFNGKESTEIKNISTEEFMKKTGLEEAISPNRRNGLSAVEQKIKTYSEDA